VFYKLIQLEVCSSTPSSEYDTFNAPYIFNCHTNVCLSIYNVISIRLLHAVNSGSLSTW